MNRKSSTLLKYSVNFLIIILILVLNMNNVNGGYSLYNDFNKKLDKLSQYADQNYDQASAEQLDKLYDKSALLINDHINKKRSNKNINKSNRNNNADNFDNDEIDNNLKNLLNVLIPFYNNQNKMDTIEKKINWIKRNPKKFQQFYTKQQETFNNNNNNNVKIKRNFNRKKVIKRNIVEDALNQQQPSPTSSSNLFQFDPKTFMNLNPSSLYPSVVAKTTDLGHLNDFVVNNNNNNNQLSSISDTKSQIMQQQQGNSLDKNTLSQYSNLLDLYNQPQLQQKTSDQQRQKNQAQTLNGLSNAALTNSNVTLDSLMESSKLPRYSYSEFEDHKKHNGSFMEGNAHPSNDVGEDCKYSDPNNASAVLERVLQELELIRQVKEGNGIPEGMPCNIVGSWNSEIIGLRFDINTTNKNPEQHDLTIKLFDHRPPKRFTLMDINWTCTGYALHLNGGPFYIASSKKKEEVLATFTGVCKTCGGVDTIFGTWSIVHPASDCRDLQMAIETKHDIFRKEMIHLKRQEKLDHMKKTKIKDEISAKTERGTKGGK